MTPIIAPILVRLNLSHLYMDTW